MAMGFAGKPISVEDLTSQVLTASKNGTLQSDLIAASRRRGMMAVRLSGLPSILQEVGAGYPVIIFENLAFNWFPRWHYALVVGYDLEHEDVVLHDGPTAYRHWGMRKFERSWKYSGYWGLVVLPPGELAVSADELTNSEAAAGLEESGRTEEAAVSYRQLLRRWPDSLVALIGLGNIAYARHAYRESASYLRQATKAHPESKIASSNLETAERALEDSNP